MSHISLSQSDITIQIERLVQAIESSNSPAWVKSRSASGGMQPTALSRYFKHIEQMLGLFEQDDTYTYSEHLKAFLFAAQDTRLERGRQGPVCLNEAGTGYLSYQESMNVLVERIRAYTKEEWYRRRDWDHRLQARKQEKEIRDYVDSVLDRYARTLVVRVNLYYRSEAQQRMRVEDMFDDLQRLIRAQERNPIFEHETGYICAVEQGNDVGYHIHAAFFFNGSYVRGDIYKAQLIGKLWRCITQGRGYHDSCNNHKEEKYRDRCGIGMIQREDGRKRVHVYSAMEYLVKDDQHLRVLPGRARTLRKGSRR
ncbi:YagK/YfjJ domain-containing protein [Stutzerimonas xanthomarina]|uniref:YagK/YfjJ domain-containing protein n=1 Tax=Stutzerimonas xanthomarina TaxID=271420 RepID=UPI0029BC3CDB|nr:inovirus-type Gp2 protein [Stutzerimonas xanthomarina]MDX2355078.1 inovirus-type Gp2 protein [Stutzerimonas xanthomarina]